jgi:hypothetical protein
LLFFKKRKKNFQIKIPNKHFAYVFSLDFYMEKNSAGKKNSSKKKKKKKIILFNQTDLIQNMQRKNFNYRILFK